MTARRRGRGHNALVTIQSIGTHPNTVCAHGYVTIFQTLGEEDVTYFQPFRFPLIISGHSNFETVNFWENDAVFYILQLFSSCDYD